jgi:hypothetical protein
VVKGESLVQLKVTIAPNSHDDRECSVRVRRRHSILDILIPVRGRDSVDLRCRFGGFWGNRSSLGDFVYFRTQTETIDKKGPLFDLQKPSLFFQHDTGGWYWFLHRNVNDSIANILHNGGSVFLPNYARRASSLPSLRKGVQGVLGYNSQIPPHVQELFRTKNDMHIAETVHEGHVRNSISFAANRASKVFGRSS